ncbi:MAG: hypothetical protein KUG56_05720, partial [Kordiimonadaceae bacterium]|nr:hypothetical protein [Kordiimonadaceae bacterium]
MAGCRATLKPSIWSNMTRLKKLTEFKAKMLLACIIAFLSSWLIIFLYSYQAFEEQRTAHHTRIQTEFQRQYTKIFMGKTHGYSAWLDSLAAKPELDGHLTQSDNNYLYLLYENEFKRLQAGTSVTHFNISDRDRNNIIRMQTPNKFGDPIPRYKNLTANNSRATTSGLYLAESGILTQRVMNCLL